jgi:hypothetical protein
VQVRGSRVEHVHQQIVEVDVVLVGLGLGRAADVGRLGRLRLGEQPRGALAGDTVGSERLWGGRKRRGDGRCLLRQVRRGELGRRGRRRHGRGVVGGHRGVVRGCGQLIGLHGLVGGHRGRLSRRRQVVHRETAVEGRLGREAAQRVQSFGRERRGRLDGRCAVGLVGVGPACVHAVGVGRGHGHRGEPSRLIRHRLVSGRLHLLTPLASAHHGPRYTLLARGSADAGVCLSPTRDLAKSWY